MPTITTGNPDACKGNNNNYEYSGVEGVAQTYTINTYSTTDSHWRLVARTNCNFSTGGGVRGSSVTVTPTNNWERLGWWGFAIDGVGSLNTSIVDETATTDTALLLTGAAFVAGSLTPTAITDLSYGIQVFNSLENLTLDLNSIQPRVLLSGGPTTVAADSTVVVPAPGLVADGTSLIISTPTTQTAGNSIFIGYNYVSGVAQDNEFKIQNFNSTFSLSTYWIVVAV